MGALTYHVGVKRFTAWCCVAGFQFAYEESNSFQWLKYQSVSLARVFLQPFVASEHQGSNTKDWKTFAGNAYSEERLREHGDQFGKSFSGIDVTSWITWTVARDEMRKFAEGRNLVDWLREHDRIRWFKLLDRITTTGTGATLAQMGNPEHILAKLRQKGYEIQVLWDFRCSTVEYTTTDISDPNYWRERWETYRLMYLGGRWMSEHNVSFVELYNEPDKDNCMDAVRWRDDMRIRSQALQDAYKDKGLQIPTIIGPSTATGWKEEISGTSIDWLHRPFPLGNEDRSWQAFDAYSFHKYGEHSNNPCPTFGSRCKNTGGYGLWRNYDYARRRLIEANDEKMPVWITEFNCYTASQTEKSNHPFFEGKHVMDYPNTASCIAAQISSLLIRPDRPPVISLHKSAQNKISSSPSNRGKNGIWYANAESRPFHVTDTTKAGEAYRLIASRAGRLRDVLHVVSSPYNTSSTESRVTTWSIEDSKVGIVLIA